MERLRGALSATGYSVRCVVDSECFRNDASALAIVDPIEIPVTDDRRRVYRRTTLRNPGKFPYHPGSLLKNLFVFESRDRDRDRSHRSGIKRTVVRCCSFVSFLPLALDSSFFSFPFFIFFLFSSWLYFSRKSRVASHRKDKIVFSLSVAETERPDTPPRVIDRRLSKLTVFPTFCSIVHF